MTREQIEKAWEEHTLCNPLIMDEYSLNERQMFVKGARWRIDNVWHYDLDKAKTRKKVLVLFTYNRVRMYNDIRDIHHILIMLNPILNGWIFDLFNLKGHHYILSNQDANASSYEQSFEVALQEAIKLIKK